MDGNNRNEPRTQFTQFDRQVLGTMHVSLDSAQVEEEKPLRSSGEMLMVALTHPNGGISQQPFTARTDAQAWLNNNRKIRKVFVIISDAEAFRAKPVSSELRLTGHDWDLLIAIGVPCRLSWQDAQHDRLVDLTRKNRAKFRKQFEREVVELMRRTIARTPFVPLLEWLFR
jgi:hypothetical protein